MSTSRIFLVLSIREHDCYNQSKVNELLIIIYISYMLLTYNDIIFHYS